MGWHNLCRRFSRLSANPAYPHVYRSHIAYETWGMNDLKPSIAFDSYRVRSTYLRCWSIRVVFISRNDKTLWGRNVGFGSSSSNLWLGICAHHAHRFICRKLCFSVLQMQTKNVTRSQQFDCWLLIRYTRRLHSTSVQCRWKLGVNHGLRSSNSIPAGPGEHGLLSSAIPLRQPLHHLTHL